MKVESDKLAVSFKIIVPLRRRRVWKRPVQKTEADAEYNGAEALGSHRNRVKVAVAGSRELRFFVPQLVTSI
jgi:hypothetical protein